MTADYQLLAAVTVEMPGNGISDNLEMLHRFVHHAALDMSRVVSTPPVAAAAAGKLIDKVQLLDDRAVRDLKDARLRAIDQRDTSMMHTVEHGRQRLQMESLIENNVALGQLGGQLE